MHGTFEPNELIQSYCYIRLTDVAKIQGSSKQRIKTKWNTARQVSSLKLLLTTLQRNNFDILALLVVGTSLHWVVGSIPPQKFARPGRVPLAELSYQNAKLKIYIPPPPLKVTISLTNRRILLKLCMWIKLVEFPCANFFENEILRLVQKLSVNDHFFH